MAPILRKLTKLNKTVHAEFADRYDELREELNEWSERFNALAQEVESELDERAPNLDEVDWPEPREADEDDDPLFDSSRDYVDQIDRYNEHQPKPVARKRGSMLLTSQD